MKAPLSEFHLRQHLRAVLSRRLFLRFHVTLLLFWTFGMALLATRLLLAAGVESMLVRYPLAVLLAWLAFVIGVRVWLWYAGFRRHDGSGLDVDPSALDLSDLPSLGRQGAEAFRNGGGSFGGGGTSADFVVEKAAFAAELPPGAVGDTAGSVAESASHAVGAVFEGASSADEAAVPLLVVGLVLAALAFLFVGITYLLIGGPEILVEAMFQAVLAGGLLQRVRRSDPEDWSGAVLRLTWKPALATLVLAVTFAIAVQHWLPQVHSITELLALLLAPAA